jgi:hypothetical protein
MGGWENPALKQARNFQTSVNKPPTASSGAADTRPPKENGAYVTNMVKGIISTASLAPLIGMPIPQVKNISTATQAFSEILTSDLLGQLPGMSMTLGSLMSNMPQALVDELYKNIPPEVGNALNAISGLMQSIEVAESGSFNTATKVNPDTFFNTAANLLSSARDTAGLVGAFQKLQSDSSLAGLDSLPPVSFTMAGGPFGDIPMQMDALGNITSLLPEPAQKLMESFSSLMTNGTQFPGVFPGANMFGGSSGVLNEMFNRLPTGELNTAVQQMQKNVASGLPSRDKVNKMAGFAIGATGGVVKLGRTALQALK